MVKKGLNGKKQKKSSKGKGQEPELEPGMEPAVEPEPVPEPNKKNQSGGGCCAKPVDASELDMMGPESITISAPAEVVAAKSVPEPGHVAPIKPSRRPPNRRTALLALGILGPGKSRGLHHLLMSTRFARRSRSQRYSRH